MGLGFSSRCYASELSAAFYSLVCHCVRKSVGMGKDLQKLLVNQKVMNFPGQYY